MSPPPDQLWYTLVRLIGTTAYVPLVTCRSMREVEVLAERYRTYWDRDFAVIITVAHGVTP